MSQIFDVYTIAFGTLLFCLTSLWLLSVYIKDASIIDIFWGPGFVVANLVTLIALQADPVGRQWLVHALVTLWGLRLGLHLFVRNVGTGEDPRYQRWRANGGENWWLASYYRIYLFQGLIMLVVAAPVIVINASPVQRELWFLDYAGIAVWFAGFLFEVASDQQLVTFKRDPANTGRVLNSGPWRYSLHPNYFGDALQWWGIWLIVASAPAGIYTIFGPIVMTCVFVFISNGVLERVLTRSKPEYEEHIRKTSHFVPLPPRE
jgi:steroid 5-alpha reductase family enzyme